MPELMIYDSPMHRMLAASVALTLGTVTLAACSSPPSPPAATVTHTSTVTINQPAPAAAASEPAPAAAGDEPAPAAMSWTMPNLIGRNLQFAQDEIQRITADAIFYTSSTDLTGKARNQVLDRNWQVCSSTPPPGSTITKDTNIDFGVVRIDTESCP
ncbi:PASTA domain-containing protein [[Mycobacterium] zoologicum]|uniref:PASTA domain-containing protein n=1 Tax=[Mycobacterium] zoologicum TaxID=2872311 RepID=UPI001CDAA056|nr:PASTA domain-containing protein [Mycolicibacter sp. MYC101]MEB3065329.1 PASTA domain-containing protein [Mycolicibacter sp. MYC101]